MLKHEDVYKRGRVIATTTHLKRRGNAEDRIYKTQYSRTSIIRTSIIRTFSLVPVLSWIFISHGQDL